RSCSACSSTRRSRPSPAAASRSPAEGARSHPRCTLLRAHWVRTCTLGGGGILEVVLRVVVLISGGGTNLKALLEAADQPDFPARVVAVGADVEADGLAFAQERGIPTFVVPLSGHADRAAWGDALLEQIQVWAPDLTVLSGFMRLLPPAVVTALSP